MMSNRLPRGTKDEKKADGNQPTNAPSSVHHSASTSDVPRLKIRTIASQVDRHASLPATSRHLRQEAKDGLLSVAPSKLPTLDETSSVDEAEETTPNTDTAKLEKTQIEQTPEELLKEISPDLTLTVEEAEMISDISSTSATVDYQNEIAWSLSYIFHRGGKNAASDLRKATKYFNKVKPSEPLQFVDKTFTTENMYTAYGWFNDFRQFFSRTSTILKASIAEDLGSLSAALIGQINRIKGANPHVTSLFQTIIGSSFTHLGNFGGLFNGVTFASDLFIVIKNTFSPKLGEEKLSILRRAYNSFTKDGRETRMVSDGLWFAVNVALFVVTGGASLFVILAGSLYESVSQVIRSYREVKRDEALLAKTASARVAATQNMADLTSKLKDHLSDETLTQLFSAEKALSDNEVNLRKLTQEIKNVDNKSAQFFKLQEDKADLEKAIQTNYKTLESINATTTNIRLQNLTGEVLESHLTEVNSTLKSYIQTRRKIAQWTDLEIGVNNKRTETIINGWKSIGMAFGLTIAFVLLSFTPVGWGIAAVATIAIAAAVLQFAAGSLFYGLCKRVYSKATAPAPVKPAADKNLAPSPLPAPEALKTLSSYAAFYKKDPNLVQISSRTSSLASQSDDSDSRSSSPKEKSQSPEQSTSLEGTATPAITFANRVETTTSDEKAEAATPRAALA